MPKYEWHGRMRLCIYFYTRQNISNWRDERRDNMCNCGGDDKIAKIIEKHKDERGALIPVLHEVQEYCGHLPLEVQKQVAEGLNISLAEVYGVVSFYSQFTTQPKGKFSINICLGTACYVKGAGPILDKLKERLGINVGECTEDGKFSIDACRCIGACGLAPVLTVNDEVHGRLTIDDVDKIVLKYENL